MAVFYRIDVPEYLNERLATMYVVGCLKFVQLAIARPNYFMLLLQSILRADSGAANTAGDSNPTSRLIIEITTSNSTRVKPDLNF